MDKKNLLVYSSGLPNIDNTEFEVVERNLANANETTQKIVRGELNLF